MIEQISESEYTGGGGNDIDIGDAEIIGMIRVTGNKVNLRKEPSTNSDSVGYAYQGDVFYYVDTDDGWFKTKSGYWIDRDYCKVMTEEEIEEYVNGGGSTGGTYSEGDTGSMVKWIQEALKALDYYDGEITGHYGSRTKEAVRQFQRDQDISADGVAGPKTIARLEQEYAAHNNSSSGSTTTVDYNRTVYNLDWFKHQSCFYNSSSFMGLRKGNTITLTDVDTGRSFKVKIQSASGNHADIEPATSSDTSVLCSLYGVSTADQLESRNKYQRRAMVVTSSNGRYQAIGSIYAIPHGSDTVSGNNYDGQFCLHFKNSKTHGTDIVDDDPKGHQAMISAAATYLDGRTNAEGNKIRVSTTCPN